jgi:hypothetical protein
MGAGNIASGGSTIPTAFCVCPPCCLLLLWCVLRLFEPGSEILRASRLRRSVGCLYLNCTVSTIPKDRGKCLHSDMLKIAGEKRILSGLTMFTYRYQVQATVRWLVRLLHGTAPEALLLSIQDLYLSSVDERRETCVQLRCWSRRYARLESECCLNLGMRPWDFHRMQTAD